MKSFTSSIRIITLLLQYFLTGSSIQQNIWNGGEFPQTQVFSHVTRGLLSNLKIYLISKLKIVYLCVDTFHLIYPHKQWHVLPGNMKYTIFIYSRVAYLPLKTFAPSRYLDECSLPCAAIYFWYGCRHLKFQPRLQSKHRYRSLHYSSDVRSTVEDSPDLAQETDLIRQIPGLYDELLCQRCVPCILLKPGLVRSDLSSL